MLPAIVTSHLNSQSKIEIAIELLLKLKEQGRKIIMVGNYPFTKEVVEQCDYCFYVRENPIAGFYRVFHSVDARFNINRKYTISVVEDYGPAHMLLMKRGFEIARNLGISEAIHLNYDVDPNSEILNTIDEYQGNTVFDAHENAETINTTFFKFEVNPIIEALDKTIDRYLKKATGLPTKGVYCESIMYWMLNEYKLQFNHITNYRINTRAGYDNGYMIDGCPCQIFIDPIDNVAYLKSNDLQLNQIKFMVDGEPINANRTSPNSIFWKIDKLIENRFYEYESNKLFMIDDTLRNRRYLSDNVNGN